MSDFDISKFDPTTAELNALVEKTKGITATDLTDKAQLEVVRKSRNELKTTRVTIEKRGKELREDALKFQKMVIAKEKELIAIISPEEDRLAAIEAEAKEIAVLEERKRKLPERLARFKEAGVDPLDAKWIFATTEDGINAMDDLAFETYLNNCVSHIRLEEMKAEKERQRIEQEEAEKKLREERAVLEAEAKKKDEERLEKERIAQAEIDKKNAELAERERELEKEKQELRRKEQERGQAEAEAKRAEEAKEREKAERLKETKISEFLSSYGWSEERAHDFRIEQTLNTVTIYKKLDTLLF